MKVQNNKQKRATAEEMAKRLEAQLARYNETLRIRKERAERKAALPPRTMARPNGMAMIYANVNRIRGETETRIDKLEARLKKIEDDLGIKP